MSSTKQAHGRLQRSIFSPKRPKQPKQPEQPKATHTETKTEAVASCSLHSLHSHLRSLRFLGCLLGALGCLFYALGSLLGALRRLLGASWAQVYAYTCSPQLYTQTRYPPGHRPNACEIKIWLNDKQEKAHKKNNENSIWKNKMLLNSN